MKKISVQKWKVGKKKNLSWVWEADRKIRPSQLQSGITRQASWCQTVLFGAWVFYLPLTSMIDPYIMLKAMFKIKTIEAPNESEYLMTLLSRHLEMGRVKRKDVFEHAQNTQI